MKKRLFSELFKLLIILFAGILYYIVILVTGFKIPCVFNYFTGYLCPGCGMTRMIISVLSLDFSSAYYYNRAVFLTLPVILSFLLYEEIKYIKSGNRKFSKASRIFFITEAALLIVFGIARNLI